MSRYGLTLQIGKSLYSSSVLIDTGAFIALKDPLDINHNFALNCSVEIARRHLPLFVTTPTICETQRRFLFDFGVVEAQSLLENIYDGSFNIIRTVEADELKAIELTTKYKSHELTLTDAINMAVMLRLEIANAFSFDRHYPQVGFLRIPPLY